MLKQLNLLMIKFRQFCQPYLPFIIYDTKYVVSIWSFKLPKDKVTFSDRQDITKNGGLIADR